MSHPPSHIPSCRPSCDLFRSRPRSLSPAFLTTTITLPSSCWPVYRRLVARCAVLYCVPRCSAWTLALSLPLLASDRELAVVGEPLPLAALCRSFESTAILSETCHLLAHSPKEGVIETILQLLLVTAKSTTEDIKRAAQPRHVHRSGPSSAWSHVGSKPEPTKLSYARSITGRSVRRKNVRFAGSRAHVKPENTSRRRQDLSKFVSTGSTLL